MSQFHYSNRDRFECFIFEHTKNSILSDFTIF